jgi:hypothetical protein
MSSIPLPSLVDVFEQVDGQTIINLVHKIPASELSNNKPLPACYKKFESLTTAQKHKVLDVLDHVENKKKEEILNVAKAQYDVNKAAEIKRQNVTTKNDCVRLMHLRIDPAVATIWSAAFSNMTRAELDGEHFLFM